MFLRCISTILKTRKILGWQDVVVQSACPALFISKILVASRWEISACVSIKAFTEEHKNILQFLTSENKNNKHGWQNMVCRYIYNSIKFRNLNISESLCLKSYFICIITFFKMTQPSNCCGTYAYNYNVVKSFISVLVLPSGVCSFIIALARMRRRISIFLAYKVISL